MKTPKKNILEWSVFAVSAVIVATVVGYLAVAALREHERPPDLRIVTGTPQSTAGGHRVPVIVRNAGEDTAENVRVEVILRDGGKELERAELDVMFVPRQSQREGAVLFQRDPRCCTIMTRVVSYEKP
jgi:uncharacterized protein (TIGR02588 family)